MVEVTKFQSQIASEARDSYSRVVVVDDWAFVSITAGVEVTPRRVPIDPAEQARKMIDNVEASLTAHQKPSTILRTVRKSRFRRWSLKHCAVASQPEDLQKGKYE